MPEIMSSDPLHVAIIMDGNGRWATQRGKPRTYGHHRGVERVREIVSAAGDLNIGVLTLFAFSTENWRRPDYEISVLMRLFRRYIVREVDELDASGIRVKFIGTRDRLPSDLQRLMEQMEARTAQHEKFLLQIAVSYGARNEITRGVREIAQKVAAGELDPDEIDEDTVSASLDTAGVRDPDLVIRTSGESRVSNFLLWQAAYAEFAFVDACWPDFTAERFAEIIGEFGSRERRFGAIAAR